MVMRKFNLRNRVSFALSIEEQPLAVAAGTYIHEFLIGIKGDLAAAQTVAIETFLDLINPFQYRVNGIPWISLKGRDIFALDVLYLGHVPKTIEGAAGEDDKVFGLRIPLWHKVMQAEAISWLVTRSAVANVSGETITIAYTTKDKGVSDIHYDIREITGTSPATTGVATAVPDLPRVGMLQGILLYSDTVPTATADTVTLQEIRLFRNDVLELTTVWDELQGDFNSVVSANLTQPARDAIENYAFIDLSEDPWDLSKDRARLDVLFGVANSPYRVIPVYTTSVRPKA